MRALVLNTDNAVVRQELHRSFATETVDLIALRPQLQFYANRRARSAFRDLVDDTRVSAQVCMLGSGDFHHLTLLRLERLAGPFLLVVFDNHADCSSIGPKYHCGNWLYHAALLAGCRKVLHVGATEHLGVLNACFGTSGLIRQGRWEAVRGSELGPNPVQRFADMLASQNAHGIPVYVSIDKDVLCEDESPGDWDNGVMRLEQLTAMLAHLRRAYPLAGADVTGEKGGRFRYPSRLLKNVLSRIEHRGCRDATPIRAAVEKQRALNCALLEVLGVTRVG